MTYRKRKRERERKGFTVKETNVRGERGEVGGWRNGQEGGKKTGGGKKESDGKWGSRTERSEREMTFYCLHSLK